MNSTTSLELASNRSAKLLQKLQSPSQTIIGFFGMNFNLCFLMDDNEKFKN